MALKVELKPNEKVIIGDCVITNGDSRAKFYISGQSPILREKDILTPETADTPAKRLYLAVQLMYLDNDVDAMQDNYFTLAHEIVKAAPSTMVRIDSINNEILTGSLYKALKEAKSLIEYEMELLGYATTITSGKRLSANG